MAFDLSTLNSEQLAPVLETEGAILVTAGAGSGKTRLLTHRIAYLVKEKYVSPYNILAITFTNKAATEMRNRILDMLDGTSGVWISTFHSMCVSIMRNFGDQIGYSKSFSIYAESEKERAIKRILKNSDIQKDEDIFKQILHSISSAKNYGLDPQDYYKQHQYDKNSILIRDVFIQYEEELKLNNALDFDDLLYKAFILLSSSESARHYYQDKFRYIHVDEFQDTNEVQYKLCKILAARHGNILVVGDEDQSIYGWRGANITNIKSYIRDFGAKIFKLEQNYRSSKKIISLANRLIENNVSRIEKKLWTNNPDGEKIELFPAQSESGEAEFIVNNIARLVNKGYSYSDFAILLRINALTRAFEEKLIQYGIPHKIYGGFKFYERKEVKDILAYLKIIVNPNDKDAILRTINFPKRGIGDSAITQLINYSAVTNISLFDVIIDINKNADLPKSLIKKIEPYSVILKCLRSQIGTCNVGELTRYLIRLLNLKGIYGSNSEENENRKQNIVELVNSMEQFASSNPDLGLEDYLMSVSLYSDLDELNDNQNCVNIATVHSAKGLEFRAVFLAGLEDGIFPVSRATDSQNDTEEERRLMYVGMTRAKERLFLSYSASRFMYGQRKYMMPSRFLSEMGFMPKTSLYASEINSNAAAENLRRDTHKFTPQPPPTATRFNVKFEKFKIGARVEHRKFGLGTIINVSGTNDNSYAEIEFDKIGKLNLSLSFAPLQIINEI